MSFQGLTKGNEHCIGVPYRNSWGTIEQREDTLAWVKNHLEGRVYPPPGRSYLGQQANIKVKIDGAYCNSYSKRAKCVMIVI